MLAVERNFLFFCPRALFIKDVDFLNFLVRPFFPKDEIHRSAYFGFELEAHKASLLFEVVDKNKDIGWFDKEENHYFEVQFSNSNSVEAPESQLIIYFFVF